MHPVLELKNVSKNFGNKTIYHDMSFIFEKGCHAIIGPNGTGKTVLMEMLAGVLRQDSGIIRLTNIGTNISLAYKKKLIYVPSMPNFFPTATGAEFLSFILSVKQTHLKSSNLDELIEKFKLNDHLQSHFKDMSLGTQKKLFLATLAIGDNHLIVLDEPTNGLDDESILFLSSLLINLSRHKTLILATHDQEFLSKMNPSIIQLKSFPINKLTKFTQV